MCLNAVESVRHVFVCGHESVRARQAAAVAAGVRVLREAGVRVVGPSASAPSPPAPVGEVVMRGGATGLGGLVCWVPVWFDVQGQFWMEFLAPDLVAQRGALGRVDGMDPLARVLGILPADLDDVLMPTRRGDGWARRSLPDMAALAGKLQLTVLHGALGTYRERCRAVAEWWGSGSATGQRRRGAELLLSRRRKRVEARHRRETQRFLARTAPGVVAPGGADPVPAPAPLRRSARRARPREFFAPMVASQEGEQEELELVERLAEGDAIVLPWW